MWEPIDPVNWQAASGSVAGFDWTNLIPLGIALGIYLGGRAIGAAIRNRRRIASAAEAGAVASLVPFIRAGRRAKRIVQAASERADQQPPGPTVR